MAPEKKGKNYSGISELLKQQGKTQTWLSEKTGIPRANINRYATAAIKKPNQDALEAMAKALKVKVEDMIEFETDDDTGLISPQHYVLEAEPLIIGGERKIKAYGRLAPRRFAESLAEAEGLYCEDAMMVDTVSINYIDRPSFLLSPDAFAVQVPDNDMMPYYKKNDILFVDPDVLWDVGDVVAVCFPHENHEMFVIRRIAEPEKEGELTLLTVDANEEVVGSIYDKAVIKKPAKAIRESLKNVHSDDLDIYAVVGCHYSR